MSHQFIPIRAMAILYPNSVWQSLIDYGDWINNLNISRFAKRLTRLQGKDFRVVVHRILPDHCHD